MVVFDVVEGVYMWVLFFFYLFFLYTLIWTNKQQTIKTRLFHYISKKTHFTFPSNLKAGLNKTWQLCSALLSNTVRQHILSCLILGGPFLNSQLGEPL